MMHPFRKSVRLQVEILEKRDQPNDMFGLGPALTFDLESLFRAPETLPATGGLLSASAIAHAPDFAAVRPSEPAGRIHSGPTVVMTDKDDYQLDRLIPGPNYALIAMTGLAAEPTRPPSEAAPPPEEIRTQQGWTFKAPDLAGPVAQVSCEYASNKMLYAAGGLNNSGVRTAAFRRWDPATDTWASLAPVPVPVGVGISNYDAMVVVGFKIYMFGGVNVVGATVNVFNNTFIYDIPTNTWSAGAPMPAPRFGSAVGYNGIDRIYVMGGVNTVVENNTWEYNISTNTWTVKAPMPTAAYRMHGATDTILGALHAYGNGFNSPEHRIYNYITDTHSTGLPVPVGITDPGTAAIPGLDILQAVAGAGTNGSGPQLTHVHETLTPSWIGSFPGHPLGNVSNTCGAIYLGGDIAGDGLFSLVGGYDGVMTVGHNQYVDWL